MSMLHLLSSQPAPDPRGLSANSPPSPAPRTGSPGRKHGHFNPSFQLDDEDIGLSMRATTVNSNDLVFDEKDEEGVVDEEEEREQSMRTRRSFLVVGEENEVSRL